MWPIRGCYAIILLHYFVADKVNERKKENRALMNVSERHLLRFFFVIFLLSLARQLAGERVKE